MTDEQMIDWYAAQEDSLKPSQVEGWRRLIALARKGAAVQWRPIAEAPKDAPILAWCDHEADPCIEDPETGHLTLYAAHAEGMSAAPTGYHIVEWGGAWDDNTHEYSGGSLPDWWFVVGSEFEQAANPIKFIPLSALEQTP